MTDSHKDSDGPITVHRRRLGFRTLSRSQLSRSQLMRRYHGSLEWITDSERRPLRPIGTTAMDVAMRTAASLAELVAIPSVRIFRGVWSACASTPLITHAIVSGRNLLLIEAVAWPPGRYGTDTAGRVLCDGLYIGQSVSALTTSVRYWRRILPHSHRVRALIVVHPSVDGEIALSSDLTPDVAWTLADNAVRTIRQYIPGRQQVSERAIAALLAATARKA